MNHRSGHVVKTLFFHYDIEDFYVNDALGMVRAAKPATAGSEFNERPRRLKR
jgi:hypothetical protein